MEIKPNEITYNNYSQSANSLFHFVGKIDYLIDILKKQALVPSYCTEDISYLNIKMDNEKIDKIIVLEKCFCDISLSKLDARNEIETEDNKTKTKSKEYLSHIDIYGKFGIALNKEWGENKGIECVTYINIKSQRRKALEESCNFILNKEDVDDSISNDIISQIVSIKPIYGNMVRFNGNSVKSTLTKNFHDEKEWRYIPNFEKIDNVKLPPFMRFDKDISTINSALRNQNYNSIWLDFLTDDIKYILVETRNDRDILINKLMSDDFSHYKDDEKYRLISKILIIDGVSTDV